MTALSVFVNERLMATVSTEGLDVLTVNIGATKIDECFATVEFSGGSYPQGGDSKHLIWLNDLELEPGQCVRVEVAATGSRTHPGKTIEELYPDSTEEKAGPMPSRDQLIAEVRARKHRWSHFSLGVKSSSGARVSTEVEPDDHGFGASFLWNSTRPERVSASLHTYTLDQLATGRGLQYKFEEHLHAGAWVEVRVDA
jgi:hypothetical protein